MVSNQKKWKMYVYKDLQANTSSLQTGNKPLTDKWINCAISTKCNTNLTKTKCIPKRRGLKLYFSTSKKDCGKIKVLPAWGKCVSTQRCTVDETMHCLGYNFLPVHHYGTILHWQIIETERSGEVNTVHQGCKNRVGNEGQQNMPLQNTTVGAHQHATIINDMLIILSGRQLKSSQCRERLSLNSTLRLKTDPPKGTQLS